MKKGVLADLIDRYFQTLSYSRKRYDQFLRVVRRLKGVEEEIVSWLEKSLRTGTWDEDQDLWLASAIVHPSPGYLPCLLQILETPNEKVPHWQALHVLAGMPGNLSKQAVPDLIRIMEAGNPAWSDEVIKKFFETFVSIGAEEGIEYIRKSARSSDRRVASIAREFVNRLEREAAEQGNDGRVSGKKHPSKGSNPFAP